MKRIKVKLKDLQPNPFKARINKGRLDDEKITKLEESVNQSGFWDGLVGREVKGAVQIAFGHHRHRAAMNVLGGDYETFMQIKELDDDLMIQMLANENSASEGASDSDQGDVVSLAKEWLGTHPESCDPVKVKAVENNKRGLRVHDAPPIGTGTKPARHVHGSGVCISAFLGMGNWDYKTVHTILKRDGLVDEAKRVVHTRKTNESHGKPSHGVIAVGAAPALAKLGAPAQKAIAAEIKKHTIPANIQKEAFKFVKEEAIEESKPEQKKEAARIVEKLEMPRAVVAAISTAATQPKKEAKAEIVTILTERGVSKTEATTTATEVVEAAQEVLDNKEEEMALAAVKAAAEKYKQDEIIRKAIDVDTMAQRIINALIGMEMPFDEDDLAEVVRLKESASVSRWATLENSFHSTAKRFTDIAEYLNKPTTKRLVA